MTLRIDGRDVTALRIDGRDVAQVRLDGETIWPVAPAILWTPADIIGDVALWLDGDDATTITHTAGAVSRWDDKSGNGRHAIHVGGTQPTLAGNRIAFDGADNLDVNPWSQGEVCYFLVAESDPTDPGVLGGAVFFFGTVPDTNVAARHMLGNAKVVSGSAAADAFGTVHGVWPTHGVTYTAPAIPAGRSAVIVNQVSTTAAALYVDGVAATPATASNWDGAAAASLSVGNSYGGGYANSVFGSIAEFVVLTGTPAAATREKMEGYLAHRWGLAGHLPAAHPYKASAP